MLTSDPPQCARSKTNVGAIVGGVIEGVVVLAAFILVLIFFRRRSKFNNQTVERPVDLLRQDDDDNLPETTQLPRYYEPEPFIVPDPTIASTSGDPTVYNAPSASLRPSGDRRFSHYSGTSAGRSTTPDGQSMGTSTYMRKSPLPPVFRPVNIVQHEDAGPGDDEPAETIELPPAYTNIKSSSVQRLQDTVPPSEATTSEPTAGSSSAAPATSTSATSEPEVGATERS